MDFHLSRKVVLSQESEYASLYKWSLRECDDAGEQQGRDQVPWNWSVVFTATELTLGEDLQFKVEVPLWKERKDDEEEAITSEEREYIRAELRPGYFADPDGGARYSMFGTDRAIKSFQLSIYKREDETKPERCYAWGSLSYTTEVDLGREETTDDTLQFYLHVSAQRFAHYVEMVRKYPANIIVLRLGRVRGLYSEWSPSIFANRIKVLTNVEDHQLAIPEGCPITPPTLGRIGEFSITFLTRRSCDKPPREIELDGEELPEGVLEKAQSPDEQGVLLQRAAIRLAVQHGQTLKYLSYAAWITAALLAVIVLRH